MVWTTPLGLPVEPEVCKYQLLLIKYTHVEDEQGVFRVHSLARAVCRDLGAFLIPPKVSALGRGYIVSSSSKNKDLFDHRALLQGGVDDCSG